jgi:hypothetical protein
MQRLTILRQAGNFGLIANTIFGQFVHLQASLFVGLALSLISIPFYAKTKMWDTVLFIGFMMVINLISALSGVPGCK